MNVKRCLLPSVFGALLLVGPGPVPSAQGAGVTAHVVAGEIVLQSIDDPYLRSALGRHKDVFLSGTAVPDEILQILQGGENIDKGLTAGDHGTGQEFCEDPKGYEPPLWAAYQACNKSAPQADKCERILAFFFGVMTHEVTDAPWHNQFIDTTSASMCEPCQSGTQPNGNGSYVWCNPGGKSVNRDADTKLVTSGLEGRHKVADGGIDACLALRLKGDSQPVLDLVNPVRSAPATYRGKTRTIANLKTAKADFQRKTGCSGSEFPDALRKGCYTCPDGYKHNPILTVSTKGVCSRPGKHFYDLPSNTTADRQHDYGGCASGQFENLEATGCYSCPAGFQHNPALTVDTSGVCFQTASATNIAANGGLCDAGQFPDPRNGGECWSCPSGTVRNVKPVTDSEACSGPGLVACERLKPPSGVSGVLPAIPEDLYPVLTSALNAARIDRRFFNATTIQAVQTIFSNMRSVEESAATAPSLFTPAAMVCSGMMEHGMDAQGALLDSAREAARFVNAMWQARTRPNVFVASADAYEKHIVSDGEVLFRSRHRVCSSNDDCGQFFTCQEGQCQYDFSKNVKCGVPNKWVAHLVNRAGAGGNTLLSVPSEGTSIGLYAHDDGTGHQKWQFLKSADGRSYNILVGGGVSGGRKYLSCSADGKVVDLYTTDDGSGRQRWLLQPSPGDTTTHCIGASCSRSFNIIVSGGVSGSSRYLSVSADGRQGKLVSGDAYQDGTTAGLQRWAVQ